MYNEIGELYLPHLRNEAHLGFHSEVIELVRQYSLTETFQGLVGIYAEHYDELNAILEIVRKSVLTEQLENADAHRNGIYRSLRTTVQGCLRLSDPAKLSSAKRLYNIVRHYHKTATGGAREDRTYAIANMLRDLRAAPVADLQLPGLTNWVSELELANHACKSVKQLRYEEWESRPEQKVIEARQVVDADYKAVTKYLDASGRLNSNEENHKQLVIALNDRVAFYKRMIAHRRGVMAAKREHEAELSSSSSSSSVVLAG